MHCAVRRHFNSTRERLKRSAWGESNTEMRKWRLVIRFELLTCILFPPELRFHKQFNSTPLLVEPPEVPFLRSKSISFRLLRSESDDANVYPFHLDASHWNISFLTSFPPPNPCLWLSFKLKRLYYTFLLVLLSWHMLLVPLTVTTRFIASPSNTLSFSWSLPVRFEYRNFITLFKKRK